MKPLITISKNAIKKINSIINSENSKAILISIKGGGCNGFNYNFTPLKTNKKTGKFDTILKIDDLNIHICGKSLMYIMGTHIDYKKDIMGDRFDFSNKNISSKCGCGTSFNFKEIKNE